MGPPYFETLVSRGGECCGKNLETDFERHQLDAGIMFPEFQPDATPSKPRTRGRLPSEHVGFVSESVAPIHAGATVAGHLLGMKFDWVERSRDPEERIHENNGEDVCGDSGAGGPVGAC